KPLDVPELAAAAACGHDARTRAGGPPRAARRRGGRDRVEVHVAPATAECQDRECHRYNPQQSHTCKLTNRCYLRQVARDPRSGFGRAVDVKRLALQLAARQGGDRGLDAVSVRGEAAGYARLNRLWAVGYG